MVLVSGSWKMYLVGLAASLVIFGVVFFTVIQPSTNTANQAIKTGLQQSQQAINQAEKQVSSANSQAGAAGSQASTVASQAQQQLSNAAKLTSCVAAAGTNASAVEACQTKYSH
jgi:F0F1-type ATP synthase membrane subunit b/b'